MYIYIYVCMYICICPITHPPHPAYVPKRRYLRPAANSLKPRIAGCRPWYISLGT